MKLTYYQSVFYNEWVLNPFRSDYNIIFDQSMSGYIDIRRLNSSLVRFVNSNLLLNSNVINESGSLHWKHRPLLSEDAQILTFIAKEPDSEGVLKLALQPFDLEKDQLARFYAIKLDNGGFRIIHIMSHILVDGLSANSIYEELSAFYNDLSYINPISLAEQKKLYEKLSSHFENILTGWKSEMSNFWENSLKDIENIGFKFLQTSDLVRSDLEQKVPVLTNPISELRFNFSEPVFLKVRQLTSKYKLTPYTFGQLVLAILIHRISGIENLVINYPVGITEGQNFIFGAHINTVFKAYRFHKESSLQDLIQQNLEYTNLLKKSKARYLPIEELISYAPTSNILEFGFVQTSLKDVVIHYEGAINVVINNDLNVDLVGKLSIEQEVRGGQINFKVRYANQKLDVRLVTGFVDIYKELFIEILEDLMEGRVEKQITNYELLSHDSYQNTVTSWNGIGSVVCDKTLPELFESQAARTPEAIALVYGEVKLSYKELNERSNRLANYLIETHALEPDDLVPLCLERSEHMLIAILGVLKSGAAYVPMDPSYPSERIEHILKDTGSKIVIAEERTIEKVTSSVITISINDSVFQTILESQEVSNPVTEVQSDNLAYVIYTSGTTGLPKGVMVEHRNVVNVVSHVREAYGFSEGEKITAYTSYVFDVSVSEFFNSLLYGNELHLLDEDMKKDADAISRYLVSHEIAYTYLPPVMLSVLPRVSYPFLKGLLYAGEPCDYETGKYWSEEKVLYNLYGPTEATIYATYKQVEHGDVHLIGRPLGNSSAYVLDASHRLVPVGVVGELHLGGMGIARGYLNRADLTEERFIANPFQTKEQKENGENGRLYSTGDLVRWLPDGNIEYIGRNDFQVKIRGYRIELGEIENRLSQYPGVKQSVVLAKENNAGMKYLAGYYVSAGELDNELLTEYLSSSLPEYMVPSVFVHLTSLPLTINGKLDRKQLPEPEFSGDREYTGPENEQQKNLCKIYGEILGVAPEHIGIHDDFFRLGGNSIMAIKLISKIKQEMDIQVNVAMVFSHKTVASLSHILNGENNQAEEIVINPVIVSSPEEQRLSFAQERLWFIETYEGGSNAYNIPMIFMLGENVQMELLQQSFETLTQRHEVLRSLIRTTKDGEGYQVITGQELPIYTGKVDSRKELDEAINHAANKVFHLEEELPVSINIFNLENRNYLSVVIHHIAFDGWSTDIFIRELCSIYQSLSEGKNPDLPELKIQYKDFALWQRDYLTGERLDQQIVYWKNKLDGFQTLDLPLDLKRPAHISYAGATQYFDLPADLVSELRNLSKDLGVSLYSMMLSGYYLMLSAYSGQDDIVVGSPVANRHHVGLENIIGFFVNTLALREKINPDQKVKDFILQVSESVTEAQSHQDLPFEKLVEELGVEQDMSRHRVFQVMFGLQSFDGGTSFKNHEAVLQPFDGNIDYQSAKFDLTMMIDDHGDVIRGIFNYAVSLFSNETIRRMMDSYLFFLKQLVNIGNRTENNSIKNLTLITKEDHQKITGEWNTAGIAYPEEKTIHQLFEDQVEKTPDQIAVVYQNNKLSYRELNQKANQLAHYLIENYKLTSDDLIPLCLERSEDMLIAVLAVLKTGAAYVPMDPAYPADRIKHILDETGAKIVLTQERTLEKVRRLDHVTGISIDEETFRTFTGKIDPKNPVTTTQPNHLAYVIYTSGTTGMPKGVMIEHRNVVNVVNQVRDAYGFSEGEKITAYTSYVFDVSVSEFFNTLLFGNELHLLDEVTKKDADSISRYLLDHQIAYAYLPPVMLSVLPKIKYPNLKGLLYAGEPCDYETGKYWSEQTLLYNLYGPTEATIYATYKQVYHGDVHLIGRPVGNASAYVLDNLYRPVPVGAVGELYIGGDGIARGYLNRPDLTAERFISNPFQTQVQKSRGKNNIIYKTGDLVRYLSNGDLEYLGRNDFQVKIRGYRIELGEIETALLGYPGIRQAVVLAKENTAGMKYLAGYYVSDAPIESSVLSEFLAESLPEYMVPNAYVYLEYLPLTMNGKLDRRQLPEPEFTASMEYAAPENELQEKLCHIYGEILGINTDTIGIHDDFFKLGGNSIMAIKLISKIRNQLDFQIQVASVFSHKTIASLSSVLESDSTVNEQLIIVPIVFSSPEEQRLSFAQERLWFIETFEGGSSAYNIPMAFSLGEKIRLDFLQKSIESVLMRHEVLRSVIRTTEKGMSYQVVTDLIPEFTITEVETREELEENINRSANKIFRLEQELPLDINVFKLKEHYYLSVVVHHIAFDGWSIDVFLKEIQAVYEALVAGKDSLLPNLKIQYKDFALWQRNYLTGDVLEKQINYWKKTLDGLESLNLPLDHKRPPYISYEGGSIYFNLSSETGSGLRKLSKDLGISLNSVMLGGYYLMLSAYSGQNDIVLGSPIANRHHAGLEDMIGFFVNTLALRQTIDPEQSLKDFILQVSRSVTEAQSHQDLPFEKLVEELGVEQDTSRHPVFQVMFGLQSFGRNSDDHETLFYPFEGEIDYQAAKFDLTTMIDDGEENIRGMFNYAVSLFNGDTIIKLKDTYVLLLEQLAQMSDAEAKNTRINDLHLLEEGDYKKMTEDWNNTVSDYSSEKTIHRLFEDQVLKTPDQIAVVYQDIKLSYKDLNEKANRLANYLIQTYNLQPDDIIPLCLDRSEEMLIAMLGVLKSGAAYAPMDPSYPADRIKHILQDTEAKLVLGQESTAEKLEDVGVDFVALDEVNIKVQLELTNSSNPVTLVNSDNLAYVIYTSGTTGLPKGVMIEHKGVSNLIKQFAKDLDLISEGTASKNCLWYANYVFDAHVWELYPVITHGHSIYLLDKEKQTDIAALQQYIETNHIRIATIPPVLLTKDYILPLEKLVVAGDVTNPQLMALYQAEGVDIINAYGPTEGTVCATLHHYNEDGNPLNIGGPIGNMTSYVLDNHMRSVPVGAVGELYIGGAGIARGYLNRPDLTEERFLENPFQTLSQKGKGENSRLYKTGDLVRWLANGELEYVGRNDFQVKIRGYRIELGEIENTLLHYPSIRQVAVLAKENKAGLKYLAGFYVSDAEIDSNLLSEYLSESLPEYMVPSAFVHLTALPLTINGKLDRRQLPEPEFTGSKDYIAPKTDLQAKLCQIYGDVLGLDVAGISIEDDFFRLGGDSIISIQLVGRIRQQLEVRLSVKEVFTARSVSSLSLLIEEKKQTKGEHILSEQGILEGGVSLLPVQEWFFSQKEQGYLVDFNHWNQAFLINVPELDKELLATSIHHLVERHDALRLQYRREDGKSIQQYGKPEIPSVNYLDASGLNPEELSHVFTEWQSGFDIENGPLYQIGYISGYADGSARIYFALHHLIIDAVSWRIITEDLKNIYQSLEKGDTEYITGHVKGTSYRQWVEAVRSYKTENPESRAQELLYWNTTAETVESNNTTLSRFIGKDYHHGHLILSKEMTGLLIRKTHHAYHTQINDLLLSALSLSLSGLTGEESHSILLESHGREEVFGNLDITETVGWFTTMYPLLLEKGKDLSDTVVLTKESLRRIPNNGVGYGSLVGYTEISLPKISFNYLGQLDQEDLSGEKSWFIAAEDSGLGVGINNRDSHYISINGAVVDGQLRFGVTGYLSEEEINHFSERLKANIETIVDQLSKESKSILTPSDIDYIVEQEQLFGIQEKGEIEGIYLANSLQEGFVYHALNQGDEDDAYRVQLMWDYHSNINEEKLKESWKCTQAAYPSLRLRFDWNDEIVQIIDKEGEVDWRYQDISGMSKEAQETLIGEITQKDRFEVYDLTRGSLFRVYLFKRGDRHYSCLFSNHHAILDGWSMPVILNSIHDHYLSQLKGEALSPAADSAYALTQQYLQSHKEDSAEFWNSYMSLLEDQEDLSSLVKEDQRHIDLGTYRHIQDHQHIKMQIVGDQYHRLKTFTKEHGFTVNAVLQYLWHKQLNIYSGLGTSVVGTTVSGRSLPVDGIESSAGLYINTLPLIVSHEDGRVVDQITEIQNRISELNTHSDTNLAALHHDGRRIFSSLFVYENYPVPKGGEGNELGFVFMDSVEKLDYPLGIMASEQGDSVTVKINYEGVLFEEQTMQQLIEGMETLLDQILKNKKITSDKLTYASDNQIKIIQSWNVIASVDSDKTLPELFESQAARTPDAIALVYGEVKLSYKELNERSNRLANYLIKTHALQPDDLVPLCLERSEHMLIAILGVLKSGAAYVPMDPSYPSERIEHILKDTGSKIVIAEERTIEKVTSSVTTISINDSVFQTILESQEVSNPVTEVQSDNLAYVIYTSGTTGLPKGVMVEHRNVVNVVSHVREAYGFSEGEKITAYTSYVFDVSVSEFFNSLLYGNELHLLDEDMKKDADAISRYLVSHEIAYTYLPSVMLSDLPRVDYPLLKGLLYAGEPCDYETGKYWSEEKVLYKLYGPTEATIYATYKQVEHGDVHLIGRPLGNSSAYVLDEFHRLMPVGAVGELYLGGVGIARGYLNHADLTEERFIANPFQTKEQKENGENGRLYSTGDLVRWLPDGNIEYIGRNDFQVKIRGYRIELREIENRLSQYPGVKQSVILAKENNAGMKYLAGYYVSADELDNEHLTEYLSSSLPEYMVPSVFVHLTSLPLTINGKLDKKQLPEPEFNGDREYVAVENDLQRTLSRIYSEVLGIAPEHISIHDDFFRLGGNSIMAIKLANKIKQELGIQVKVAKVLTHKTIVSLANVLGGDDHIDEQITITPIEISSPEEQRLSFAQERLWFIEAYEGGSSAYNIPMTVILNQKTDVSVLCKALEKVIMRHEVLRTLIKTNEYGMGYQVVTDRIPEFKITEVETREELDQYINKCANKVFRLDSEIPVEINIFRFKGQHYLSVVIHHIAFDGWSTEVFLKELTSLYDTLSLGIASTLPELKIQYKDFALWQRNYLSGKRLDSQIEYWKVKFDDYQSLDLPTDFHRPADISYEGETINVDISGEISKGIREISRNLGVSVYSVMLSGYYLMLSAYSGQNDIVLGSPIANRHHSGLENIIGFFVNTLALREKIDSEQKVKDFILQVADSVTEAQSHQDLPFEKLVEELGVEQDTSRHPVFQVMFGLQNFGDEDSAVKEEEALFYSFDGEVNYQAAKFDLTTMVHDGPEAIQMSFNYATSLFRKETIVRMADSYQFLLNQMVKSGRENTRIDELSLIAENENKLIVEVWNNNHKAYKDKFTIHQLFENQVEMTPDTMALVYQNVRLSYRELNERANRLANHLIKEYHLQPDDLVPLCLERSEDIIIASLAVMKAGAAYVPMDPSYTVDRLKHIVKDTGSKVILTQKGTANKLIESSLGKADLMILDSEKVMEKLDQSNSDNPVAKVSADNLAYVIYTSGTTGLPKGVMIEHSGVINLIESMIKVHRLEEYQEVGCFSNYVFDAFVYEAFPALCNGNTLWIYSNDLRTSVSELNDYIKENNIKVSFIPPALLREVIDNGTHLKLIFAGGESFPALDKNIDDIMLVNEYGPTEGTVCATFHYYKEGNNPLNIGRPIANTTAYILDGQCRAVPVGAIGELYIGGSGIARGYLNQPELTKERFLDNPFQTLEQKEKGENGRLYKTGDLVRRLSSGELEYIGRNDFQVKIRGYRIELGEIENRLLQYPGVKQTVVMAKENRGGMKYLAGYYVSDPFIDPHMISEFLSETLPDYMIPNVYIHLEHLPLTINGKIDRKRFPEPGFIGVSEYAAPKNDLQRKLAGIYGEVLDLNPEEISIHDDFFKLGGNSIMAIKLIKRIHQQLDVQLKIVELFKEKTISKLSRMMMSYGKEYKPIVAFNQENCNPKMFLIHPGNGGCEVYQSLAEQLRAEYDCYGVDSYNLYNEEKISNMKGLAHYYLEHIDDIQKDNQQEEYILLGWSLGGNIALEIASELENRGRQNITVYLLDTVFYASDQKLMELLSFPTDEELSEKLNVSIDDRQFTATKNFMLAEYTIIKENISNNLNSTKVVLFKAMLEGETFNDSVNSYVQGLACNNVDSVIENRDLLSVYPINASHQTILEQKELIIDLLLKKAASN